MTAYVEPHEQLVVEVYVRNLAQSIAFYTRLGFTVIRAEPDFAELQWETSLLFLEEIDGLPDPPSPPACNVRIMVPDVDRYWTLCQELGLPVLRAIDDRYYGLRDFTVVSPDGIGLRFASLLANHP